jgi:hypothetical protein
MEPPGMRLSGISCEMDHHADEPWPGMVQAWHSSCSARTCIRQCGRPLLCRPWKG